VVLACGGFEANPEMRTFRTARAEAGEGAWQRYNTGDGIRMALDTRCAHGPLGAAATPSPGRRRRPWQRLVGDLFQKHSYPLASS
jgi:tricarballylate dehydrogenase